MEEILCRLVGWLKKLLQFLSLRKMIRLMLRTRSFQKASFNFTTSSIVSPMGSLTVRLGRAIHGALLLNVDVGNIQSVELCHPTDLNAAEIQSNKWPIKYFFVYNLAKTHCEASSESTCTAGRRCPKSFLIRPNVIVLVNVFRGMSEWVDQPGRSRNE
jgi:hypothetical protein